MITNVKARFSNGSLTPLQPLDLDEGAEVTLRIVNVTSKASEPAAPPQPEKERARGSGTHPVIAMIDRLRAEIPASADDDLPTDLSKNIDHYLYGAPKESDS